MDSTTSAFLQHVIKIFLKFYRVERMAQLSDNGHNNLAKLLILFVKF